MKKLFDFGNRYARQSDWTDFALTKLCLFSMGLAVGALVSDGHRTAVIAVSVCVFAVTCVPLIVRMIRVARGRDR